MLRQLLWFDLFAISVASAIANVPASPHRRPLVTFTSAEKKELFAFKERFLYNEKEQLAVRNIKFNPDAAQRVACSVVGGDCTSFEVLTDGGYNRVFVLGFDNGQEVVLRIPWSPLAGPPHAMIASEVATMEFMREVLDVPVPRVLAWSANAQTSPIGSEFILMEPVAGQSFESQYLEICTENIGQFGAMMRHFVEIQGRCAELAFSQIGSLYFKEDVSRELQDRPLFSESINMDDKLHKASERYRIGPLTDRQWWRCERQSMDLDRGPWPDVVSYFRAAALSEISFINSPYALRSSFRKAPLETREEHLKHLNDCLTLIPYIVPPAEFCSPTIWFPDASGTNIMTDSNFKITGLIDWQQAVIAPYFTQHMEFPSAFKYTEGLLPIPSVGYGILLSNIDEFDPEFQKLLHLHRQKVTRHRAYEIAIAKVEPKRE
ncbi:Mitochondrial inheritance protein 9 [Abortiporus biennis]